MAATPPTPAKKKGKSALSAYVEKLPKGKATIKKGRVTVTPPRATAPKAAGGSPLTAYASTLKTGPAPAFAYRKGDPEISALATPPKTAIPDTGGWFQNLGKDALSMVTGLPGTIALAARTAATVPIATHGYTAGLIPFVPGGEAARKFSAGTGKDLVTAGKATLEDLKYRYGPAFQGDWGKFGSRIKEHPGFFALDVASVASAGAGTAVKAGQVGVKAGRALESARRGPSYFPENTPPPQSSTLSHVRQPAGRSSVKPAGRLENKLRSPKLVKLAESRQMKNRIRTRKITSAAETMAVDGRVAQLDIGKSTVRLRNAPPSPLARYMTDTFDTKVLARLERMSNKRGEGTGFMSTGRRDTRALSRDARRKHLAEENVISQALHEKTRDFAREVLYKRGISKDKFAEALVTLRSDGVAIDKGGKKASVRVGELLDTWEAELARDRARGIDEKALAGLQKNIDLVKSIPVDMIDNPSPLVVRATNETNAVRQAAQDFRERTGGKLGIRGATRSLVGVRREAVSTGRATFAEDFGSMVNPAKREKIIRENGYEFVPKKAVTAAARIYLDPNRGAPGDGPAARAVARLVAEGRLPMPGTAAAEALREGSKLDAAVAAGLREMNEGKVPLTPGGKIDVAAREAQYRTDPTLRALLDDPDNLFPEGETASMDAGYRASIPVGQTAGHSKPGKASGGFGQTGRADKRATGESYLGRDSLSRETTMIGIQRAITSFYTKQSVRDTIDRYALREVGSDKPFAVASETAAKQLDPEKWSLVSTRGLEEMMKDIDVDNPGMQTTAKDMFDSPRRLREAWEKGGDTVVALPRKLVDEMKLAAKEPSKLVQKYDSALNMWRAGILAYTPRWFVNNLIGTSIFLGVMSGIDLRAFRQASRDGRFYEKNVIPHQAESVSHAAALGEGAGDVGRGGLEKQARTRFQRGAHTMFRLNERLEGRLRRAAYLSRARQNLRTEGLIRDRNWFKSLTDDELFDAMVKMPDELKKQTLTDIEFFVGNYKNYSRVEREVFRRVIPFYSWMRVINTWAFGMPFKSPLRAEAVRIASTMGAALQEDTNGLPLWEKGRLTFGPFALRTNNINPLYSVAEEIAAVTGGAGDFGSAGMTDLLRVAGGSASPPLQMLIGQISGRSPFGTRDFGMPTGIDGSVSSFGKGRTRRDPITGSIEDYHPAPNLIEQAFDSIIPFAGTARSALAGQQQPYDSSSSLDLLAGRLGLRNENELYQPPAVNPRGRGKLPFGLGAAAGLAGAPIYTVDKQRERLMIEKQHQDYLRAQLETKRQLAKETLRRGQTLPVVYR